MTGPREFDLVLQGATGFTGRLAAEELRSCAPSSLRWAVAGRCPERVHALARKLDVQGLVADGLDRSAVGALAARTRVVLSCAGPFTRWGSLLVAACVEEGVHYADLTGELPWMETLIDRHHEDCVERRIAIVPASGFDSVPTDLGVQALVTELGQAVPIHGFFTLQGGLNGGTLHSGLALAEDGSPPTTPSRPIFPLPVLDRWAAPFLMAPVNERVVGRSAEMMAGVQSGYGPSFLYREHLLTRGRAGAWGMATLLKSANRMLASPSGRWLLRRFGPKPGEGPSERAIRMGFANLVLLAGPLNDPIAIRRWAWDGDPGNRITVRCLVQTGLALAAGEALRGGVLTPASALGSSLFNRLQDSGAVREGASGSGAVGVSAPVGATIH